MYYSSFFFFSSRRRHTRFDCDWSSDVCSSDLVGELVATPGQLDGVGDEGGETEGGAVDQADLAVLDLVDRPALAALQRLGKEQDRGERGPQVVDHLDQQVEALGSAGGEALAQLASRIVADRLADLLEGVERAEDRRRRDGCGGLGPRLQQLRLQHLDEMVSEARRGTRQQRRDVAGAPLIDGQRHGREQPRHGFALRRGLAGGGGDRKSTRLNSSHSQISYAV